MWSRRNFLCLSSATLAGVAVPELFAQREGMPVFSNASLGAFAQGSLTKARFQSLVGSPFRIFLENRRVANLTLVSVTSPDITQESAQSAAARPTAAARNGRAVMAAPGAALPASGESPSASSQTYIGAQASAKRPTSEQCFQATFSSGRVAIPQDSYVVDHASLGNITLFLVPGLDAQGGNTVTASFFYL